ncbi:MAG: hypothetical protein WA160_03985 [Pseudobdellovibrio sp.]
METRPILAVHTRNCAKFVRVTYYFDFEIDKTIFSNFKDFKCEINEFSKFVSGAKDHFKLASFDPAILISGVFGDKNFEVAYGKFSKVHNDDVIKKFESDLIQINFGTHVVEYKKESIAT